jgi:phage-related minor tail protein
MKRSRHGRRPVKQRSGEAAEAFGDVDQSLEEAHESLRRASDAMRYAVESSSYVDPKVDGLVKVLASQVKKLERVSDRTIQNVTAIARSKGLI